MKEKIENMPILVFLLVGVALSAFNYMGSLSTNEALQTEISQLNTQAQEKREALTKAQNSSSEIPAMKEEIDNISQALSKSTEFMPVSTTAREILTTVSNEAKVVGIRVPQSRPADAIPKNYYEELPIEVEFEGSYGQLAYFMYNLSKQKLIIHPVDMELTGKEIKDGQTNLKMTGKIVGFRYKETKLSE